MTNAAADINRQLLQNVKALQATNRGTIAQSNREAKLMTTIRNTTK